MRKTTLLLSFLSLAASGMLAQQYQGPDFSAAKFEMQSAVNRHVNGSADSTVYSYNNRHLPLEQLTWTSDQGSAWEFDQTATQGLGWNDMGQQTLQYSALSRIERTFDARGQVTVESNYERQSMADDFTLTREAVNTYDSEGRLTREQVALTGLRSGVSSVSVTAYDYNSDGTLAKRTYEVWLGTTVPTGAAESGTMIEYTYQPESSVAVETVTKIHSGETSEWVLRTTTTSTLAKLPVRLTGDTDDYYAAKSVDKDSNGDTSQVTEMTVEYSETDKIYTERRVITTESMVRSDETRWLVTEFDKPANTITGMLSLSNVSSVRQPGMETITTRNYKYDDGNRLVEVSYMLERAFEGQDVMRNGNRQVNVYDDLGRQTELYYYVLQPGQSDFVLTQHRTNEYVDNTPAVCRVVDNRALSDGEDLQLYTEQTCEYDMSVPFSEIATFVYQNLSVPFRYMPLKVETKGYYIGEYTTTYNYRAIESGIEAIGSGDATYGVWPAVTTGELNVVVPEGVTPDVTVYSAGGAVVARSQADRLQLDAVPAGFYIVKVNGHTSRIIKK